MRLRTKSRARLIFALILIIALPLFVWAVATQRLEFRKKAASGEPSACSPLGNTITVSPEGSSGTCHDIQTAINAVSGPNFTINIAPGSYNVPESGSSFSLTIANKSYLTITGNAPAGIGAVQLLFDRNRGGVLIENSTNVSIEWITINGNTTNGLLSSRGSTNTSLGYLVLADQTAHTVDFSNGSGGSLYNSDITSFADAIDVDNMQGINISYNVIHNAHGGISINNSNGSILANLFDNNSGPSLLFNQANNFHIQSNTIVHNLTSELNNDGSILVTNPQPSQTSLIFEKNIVAINTGAGININNDENVTFTFYQNDFYSNQTGNYTGIPDQTGSNGNISADPLFGTDYCLRSGSPAILPVPIGGGGVVPFEGNQDWMGHRGPCGPLPTTTSTPASCTNQPDGTSCSTTVCPACYYLTPRCLAPCRITDGTCQNQTCVPLPSPFPTPNPTPPPGCVYITGCTQSFPQTCTTTLVCPTPTTTQNFCVGKADGTICDAGYCPPCPLSGPCPKMPCRFIQGSCQNGECFPIPTTTISPPQYLLQMFPSGNIPSQNIGSDTSIYVLLTNNGSIVPNQQDLVYTWSIDDPSAATITPFAQCAGGVQSPCPLDHLKIHALKKTALTNIHVSVAKSSNPGLWLASATFNLTVTGGQLNLQFNIRFGGVTDGAADGATATIRFVNVGSGINLVTPPIVFRHVDNGIYSATVSLDSTQLPPGPGYTIIVKGEKHVALKFCKQGQTAPCQAGDTFDMPAVFGVPVVIDFTHLSLPPGDLPPQDGQTDLNDFNKIKTLLSKPCSQLTDSDKYTADLDYSGCINVKDVVLFRKTLEIRYDEN